MLEEEFSDSMVQGDCISVIVWVPEKQLRPEFLRHIDLLGVRWVTGASASEDSMGDMNCVRLYTSGSSVLMKRGDKSDYEGQQYNEYKRVIYLGDTSEIECSSDSEMFDLFGIGGVA